MKSMLIIISNGTPKSENLNSKQNNEIENSKLFSIKRERKNTIYFICTQRHCFINVKVEKYLIKKYSEYRYIERQFIHRFIWHFMAIAFSELNRLFVSLAEWVL